MGAVRRWHAMALLALATLLLLLLAHLPTSPTPRTSLPHLLSLSLAPTTNHTTLVLPPSPVSTTPHGLPVPHKFVRDPRVVYTVDKYTRGYSRSHPELCPALGAHLRLVILVASAPSHVEARDAVRFTWGHYGARSDIAFAFVLGAPPLELLQSIDREDALYGDLIVGRFVDSYSNLTLKTLSMLEWMDTYCPHAPLLFKTDDDMFVNMPRLLWFVAAPARVNATRTIWGKLWHKSLPKRTTNSKYYVSPVQFPGRVFPDFTTGGAYLLTVDCVRPLLDAAGPQPYLPVEDVFVTGVLATKLGITRRHVAEFCDKKTADRCALQRSLAVHMVQYHEQFDFWRKLLDGKSKCA